MTDSIQAIVVDDEYLGRQNIRALLSKAARWHVASDASNGEIAVEKIVNMRPDVAFLDIDMPGLNGMQVARELLKRNALPLIVFVTAYSQYAIQAFEINAVDYLLKPVRNDRFNATIQRIEHTIDTSGIESGQDNVAAVVGHLDDDSGQFRPWLRQIAVRSIGRVQFVDVEEIIWIAASGNYVELHLNGSTVLYRQTLKSLSSQLNPDVFMQIHRSAIVNRSCVRECTTTSKSGHLLRMSDNSEIAVSDRSWKYVKGFLLEN